jgi:hypothetical protein
VGFYVLPAGLIIQPHPHVGIDQGCSLIAGPFGSWLAHSLSIPGDQNDVQEDFIKNIKPMSFLQ